MNCKNIIIVFSFYALLTYPEITFHTAQQEHISAIIELDKTVCLEFFKPLMAQGYSFVFDNNAPLLDDILSEWNNYFAGVVNSMLNNTVNNPDQRILIATDDEHSNNLIGFCCCEKNDDVLFIHYLIISREMRGKGIGKKLLDRALSLYSDVRVCELYTLSNNEAAQKFYERYGFTTTKELYSLLNEIDYENKINLPAGLQRDFKTHFLYRLVL